MEGAGQLARPSGEPVGRPLPGRFGHDVAEGVQGPQHLQLAGVVQHLQGHLVQRWARHATLGGGGHQRADAGVRVLHVEHRVLHGLRRHHAQVDGLAAAQGLQQERHAGGVGPDEIHQVVEQHHVAGPLGDLGLLAPAHHRDELPQHNLELLAAVPQGAHAGRQALHVAVVVCTPHVDQQVEAAGQLVGVVGDVGQQVGGLSVGAHQHPILVVAAVGAAQPGGAVGAVGGPGGLQGLQDRVGGAGADQGPLAGPGVEPHAEARQALGHVAAGAGVAPLQGLDAGGHLGRPLPDVVAVVAVGGRLGALLAGHEGFGEGVHLTAAVVEVVLPVRGEAAAGQNVAERVAVGRPAPAAHVQRPGGVRTHELHVHRRPGTEVVAGVTVDPVGDHLTQHVVQPAVVEVEVHEPRPRHLHPAHVGRRVGGDVVRQLLRQVAGVPPGGLGADQRHVGGPVAVLGAGGAPDLDRGRQGLDTRAGERATQGVDQVRADHRANPLERLGTFR